jgi:hypothetical protein
MARVDFVRLVSQRAAAKQERQRPSRYDLGKHLALLSLWSPHRQPSVRRSCSKRIDRRKDMKRQRALTGGDKMPAQTGEVPHEARRIAANIAMLPRLLGRNGDEAK